MHIEMQQNLEELPGHSRCALKMLAKMSCVIFCASSLCKVCVCSNFWKWYATRNVVQWYWKNKMETWVFTYHSAGIIYFEDCDLGLQALDLLQKMEDRLTWCTIDVINSRCSKMTSVWIPCLSGCGYGCVGRGLRHPAVHRLLWRWEAWDQENSSAYNWARKKNHDWLGYI